MFEKKLIFKNVGGINEKFRGFRNSKYISFGIFKVLICI